MKPFYTKRGRLTAYAFGCGYAETDGPFRLYRAHGAYHVRGFDANGTHHSASVRTLADGRRTLQAIGHIYGRPPISRSVVAPPEPHIIVAPDPVADAAYWENRAKLSPKPAR